METVHRDYSPKGVEFYYIYKALAHPELNGYINPVTLEERLMHIAEAKRTLGSEITWLADNMDNELKHALGNRPNSEYLLDPAGNVLKARGWSDPAQLRRDLEEYVGTVEKPTTVAALNMEFEPPPNLAPTGVVSRIAKPGFYRTLTSEPQLEKTEDPFYVKLRAEADQGLTRDGKGKLYLAFLLDPLYGVHWNNLSPPVDVQLTPAEGMQFSETKLTGPKVEQEADSDPREFLIDVDLGESRAAVPMTFRYYACTEKWCRPVTQEYLITWDVNRDAGRVQPRRGFGPGQGGGGGRGGPGGRDFLERIWEMDLDGDDKLSPDEVPEQMSRRWDQMDANSDGFLDREELSSFRPGGPGQRRGPGGRGPGGFGNLMERDADGDGKLSVEELPEPMRQRFERMDGNADGFLDQAEVDAMRQRSRGPGGPPRR